MNAVINNKVAFVRAQPPFAIIAGHGGYSWELRRGRELAEDAMWHARAIGSVEETDIINPMLLKEWTFDDIKVGIATLVAVVPVAEAAP